MIRLRPLAASLAIAIAIPSVAFAQDAPVEVAEEAPPPVQIEIDVAAEAEAAEAEKDEAGEVETEAGEVETEDPLPGGVVALPEPDASASGPSVRVTVDLPPTPPAPPASPGGDGVPDGYYLKRRRLKGLMIAGGVTFAASWLASYIAAQRLLADTSGGRDEWPGEASLAIPVAGPWMALKQLDDLSERDRMLIAGSGLAQAGGLIMVGVGLFYEDTVLVKKETVEISAAPLLGPGVAGAALSGTF